MIEISVFRSWSQSGHIAEIILKSPQHCCPLQSEILMRMEVESELTVGDIGTESQSLDKIRQITNHVIVIL